MSTLIHHVEAAAAAVEIRDSRIVVRLADGRILSVPLDWYPRLLHASESERDHWTLLGGGYAIEWPDLDEHIGVEALLAGRRSGESAASFERWLTSSRARP